MVKPEDINKTAADLGLKSGDVVIIRRGKKKMAKVIIK